MRWIPCVIAFVIGFVVGVIRLPWEIRTELKHRRP